MRKLYSGNEAVARGAYEAGVEIAAAYPGTPSTEILENVALYKEIYVEWSVNEKVAFEVAFGGSVGGKRSPEQFAQIGLERQTEFRTGAFDRRRVPAADFKIVTVFLPSVAAVKSAVFHIVENVVRSRDRGDRNPAVHGAGLVSRAVEKSAVRDVDEQKAG